MESLWWLNVRLKFTFSKDNMNTICLQCLPNFTITIQYVCPLKESTLFTVESWWIVKKCKNRNRPKQHKNWIFFPFIGEKMYPMSMSPEGVTDDEISAASMSETDTSLLNSASLPAMDDDQSESNSENNNDSASGQVSFILVGLLSEKNLWS